MLSVHQKIKSKVEATALYHAYVNLKKYKEAKAVVEKFKLHSAVAPISEILVETQKQEDKFRYLQFPLNVEEDIIIVDNSLDSVARARTYIFKCSYVGLDSEWFFRSSCASILQVYLTVSITIS
jgi:hypothetical protein